MRAYTLEKGSKRPRLVELPRPEPGPGAVRVRVTAVSIHPVDVETAAGGNALILPMARPFVPGVDFVGVIEAVGPGVMGPAIGEHVMGYRGIAAQGAFAELLTVPADELAVTPTTQPDEELACLPLPALCALQALEHANLASTGRVLVHGGAGGVGSVAVQVFSRLGHEVVATASAANAAWVHSLGAARVIDVQAERFEQAVREQDLVLDTVGGDTLIRSFAVVRPGGLVASLRAAPAPAALEAAGLKVPWFMSALLPLMAWRAHRAARAAGASLVGQVTVPSGARLTTLAALSQGRPFATRIHQTLPFESLPDALDLVASGAARGRVVVKVS